MIFLLYFLVFIFGTLVGSFLNCVIYRLETSQGFLKGRSFCPECKHQLGFFDLIPILSFIILRGRCRYCGGKISWQYPLVEIATGSLFLLIFNFQFFPELSAGIPVAFGDLGTIFREFLIFNFKTIVNFLYLLIVCSFLILIFVYDLKHYIIPDKVIYPAIIIVFIYRLFEIFKFEFWNLFRISDFGFRILESLKTPFLAGFLASAFFLAIFLVSRGKWLGFGDVKLAFFMGLFLSFPQVLVAFFFSFLLGAIIGVGLIALGKKQLKSQVPFGPFLVTGIFVALFWGEALIRWYLNLLA